MCSQSHFQDECEALQDLIVWYPGESLNANENARVEKHIAACSSCANLLHFSAELKVYLVGKHQSHPASSALVSYVEDAAAMDPGERAFVEDHLAVCADCKEQMTMLEAVEKDLPGYDRAVPAGAAGGLAESLRRFWRTLGVGMLKPAPAALYLIVAVFAVGFHLFGPGGRFAERTGGETGSRTEFRVAAGAVPGAINGVVILADENSRVRSAGTDSPVATTVDIDSPQYLLLELTGLEAPPAANAVYTVELLAEDSGETLASATVTGSVFSENYTICLPLGAGELAKGAYVVRVVGPDKTTVFRSRITVE